MILDKFSLAGKYAVVTGASRGLGAGIAVALAEAGADVAVINARHGAEGTVEAIRALGRRAVAITSDLADINNIGQAVAQVNAEFGRIDILVNCAGINRRVPALECSEADWDAVLNINLKAMYFLSQAVAREMVKQGKGKIIQIASMNSYFGALNVSPYTASKHGVAGITKAMANEWAAYGINVNAIAPGYMRTDLTQALQDDAGRFASISQRIPCGRWGVPDDVKGAAVFLASAASDYVQGHILTVDGGYLGW